MLIDCLRNLKCLTFTVFLNNKYEKLKCTIHVIIPYEFE